MESSKTQLIQIRTQKKRIVFVNIYATNTIAKYMVASYVLKNFLRKIYTSEELEIEVLNFGSNAEVDEIYRQIATTNPDFVGYSCYVWNTDKIMGVIEQLKETNPSIKHILGGPEISLTKIESLQPTTSGDYFIVGQGEKALSNLVSYLLGKQNEIPEGIAYWEENKLIHTHAKDIISNLDEIPSIYLDNNGEKGVDVGLQAFLETQRGCKFRCQFCLYHKNLPVVSYFSIERVLAELDVLIQEKKIKALRIVDAIFTSDIERAKKIVRHLIELKKKEDVKLPWIYWEYTIYHYDDEFLELVSLLKYKDNICNSNEMIAFDRPQLYSQMLSDYTSINCIGVQSFCNEALNSVSRFKVSKEKFDQFMKTVNKYNLVIKIDMILGLPFETFKSYFDGLEFMLPYFKDTDHILNIHGLQVLPGSDLEQHCGYFKIKYFETSPRYIYATNTMTEDELSYASKLSGLLFRISNSPLRKELFATKARTGKTIYEIIETLFKQFVSEEKFKETQLIKERVINDEYWNADIYKDIHSNWVLQKLAEII